MVFVFIFLKIINQEEILKAQAREGGSQGQPDLGLGVGLAPHQLCN